MKFGSCYDLQFRFVQTYVSLPTPVTSAAEATRRLFFMYFASLINANMQGQVVRSNDFSSNEKLFIRFAQYNSNYSSRSRELFQCSQ